MGKINLGDAFNQGWAIFSKNIVALIVGGLLVGILSAVSLGILAPVMVGGMFIMIKKASEGQTAEIGDVFGGFSNFGTLFLGGLIGLLALVIGSIACGIGALFTGSIVIFLFPLIVDKGMGAGEAWSTCWNNWKKNIGGWLVLYLVVAAVSGAGSAVMGFGALLTMPFAMCVLWAGYLQVFGGEETAAEAAPAPPVEPTAEG